MVTQGEPDKAQPQGNLGMLQGHCMPEAAAGTGCRVAALVVLVEAVRLLSQEPLTLAAEAVRVPTAAAVSLSSAGKGDIWHRQL